MDEKKIKDPAECKQLLIDEIKRQMDVGETAYEFENRKSVVLMIGVNGVGKTTSVGSWPSGKLKDQGKKVLWPQQTPFGGGRRAAKRMGAPGRCGLDRRTGRSRSGSYRL